MNKMEIFDENLNFMFIDLNEPSVITKIISILFKFYN